MITTKELQYLRENWNGYVGHYWGIVINKKSIEMLLCEKRGIIFTISVNNFYYILPFLNNIVKNSILDIANFLEYTSIEEYRKEKSTNHENIYQKIYKKLNESDDTETERIYVL